MTDDRLNTMRVAHRIAEGQAGRWRVVHFTETAEGMALKQLKLEAMEPPERLPLALRRLIPPGTYASLQRRMIQQEVIDAIYEEVGDPTEVARRIGVTTDEFVASVLPPENRWTPIMSDTPAELEGHADTLEFYGNVLVTGLGLGCVLSGLLANDEVDRIDVAEIDPDVIRLISPYYQDPRIHIWHGSAIDPSCVQVDENFSWDFAWHDIWTHVAERNLNSETAEHGISYDRMFSVWEGRANEQYAWAYDDALEAREVNERIRQRDIAWYEALLDADIDRQVEMLQDKVITEKHPQLTGRVDAEVRAAFDPTGTFAAHLRGRILHEPEFLDGMKELAAASRDGDEPLGRPNEEASV